VEVDAVAESSPQIRATCRAPSLLDTRTGTFVRIWGRLHRDVPDAYGVQIVVTRLEIVSQ
jgi:hypothetical protein